MARKRLPTIAGPRSPVLPSRAQDNWLLHPYLAIHLKNIHRLHHASDTGTYDEEGRMYPRVGRGGGRSAQAAPAWREGWHLPRGCQHVMASSCVPTCASCHASHSRYPPFPRRTHPYLAARPQKFEEIWEVLGAEQLASWADVRRLLAANRCVGDPLGWLASAVSWGLLYSVARDERGVLGREAVRRCFDGTLFYALAEGRRARALASKYE